MKQRTAHNIEEALHWIHTQPHHEAGIEDHPATGKPQARWFRNHDERMRVRCDEPWFDQFLSWIEPQSRPHDDRMWRVTRGGRRVLFASSYGNEARRHP